MGGVYPHDFARNQLGAVPAVHAVHVRFLAANLRRGLLCEQDTRRPHGDDGSADDHA